MRDQARDGRAGSAAHPAPVPAENRPEAAEGLSEAVSAAAPAAEPATAAPAAGSAAGPAASAHGLVRAVVSTAPVPGADLERLAAGLNVGPAELAPLLDAVRSAREEVASLRERRRELTALADSARIMANATDVEETLAHVVRLAHNLVVSDVTYLSEYYPETGDLRVRATQGAATRLFATLPVPQGYGLASYVAETRAPHAVHDYLEAAHLRHHGPIDTAVAEERLVSLVGVPLISGGTVLGVLFAGTRTAHRYSPEEIAILSALADHAAIALLRSFKLGDLERSGQEAATELARWERLFAHHRHASEIVDALFAQVLDGADVHRVVARLAAALDRSLLLVDDDGRILADSAHRPGHRFTETTLLAALGEGGTAGGTQYRPAPESATVEGTVAVPTGASGALHLIIERTPVPGEQLHPETVARGAQTCAFAWLLGEAGRVREDQRRDHLLAELLGQTYAPESLLGAAADAGLTAAGPLRLCIVDGPPGRLRALRSRLTAQISAGVLCGMHAGHLGVLSAEDSSAPVLQIVRQALEPGTGLLAATAIAGEPAGAEPVPASRSGTFSAGAAAPDPGDAAVPGTLRHDGAAGPRTRPDPFRQVRALWDDCVRAVSVQRALGWGAEVVDAGSLLPYALLQGMDRARFDQFVAATIGAVLEYDERRGANLFETLRAYYDAGRSISAAAQASRFHVNTVSQRLSRVDELLGAGWRDAQRSFLVETAVRLVHLDQRLRG
ncbi:hypothetical protein GCM10011333_29650 [Sediminivirga luteola]|uniref:GAF domain-containing protein n=1 Tax=Sediminivirga luteola TaxID=1774748 RepID=A0A8J2U0J7_9MICO|nr:hypothetical protein GCM10011333_29650 [Sediminivirga luteola]